MFVQLLMQEGETLLLKAWNGLSHWVSELKIAYMWRLQGTAEARISCSYCDSPSYIPCGR
ncbi:hypothetical protein T4E_253 [Trichinella pseudospiralis]|uniref:Uncharacterized protein n=1 Tax=Trichinella pseudospiralis TaxID=6337 RepID=A0A0V0YFP7_TRIPS|nr:hypothetical protein T4E_253 [Trichinella pseudospiralis]